MPGVKRVQVDGWGGAGAGKVLCTDTRSQFAYQHPHPPQPLYVAHPSQVQQYSYGNNVPMKVPVSAPYAYKNMPPMYQGPNASKVYGYGVKAQPITQQQPTITLNPVDPFEVEIAKTCAQITKQMALLPVSLRECSVCLAGNAQTQIVACGHTFHSKCFLRWFRANRSCPLCRGAVDSVQLAPVVENEVDAIMAESDDEMEMEETEADDASEAAPALIADPELMSYLSSSANDSAAGDMMLDASCFEPTSMLSDDMDIHMDGATPPQTPTPSETSFVASTPVAMTSTTTMTPVSAYLPSTTTPNYWCILNNGNTTTGQASTLLPLAPSLKRSGSHVHAHLHTHNQPRMIHIAPKPEHAAAADAHTHTAARAQVLRRTQALNGMAMGIPLGIASPTVSLAMPSSSPSSQPQRTISCRCAGGCRNGRCACVKEGHICGVTCRCTSCKNPFLPLVMAGLNIAPLVQDDCFMHNLAKIRDLMQKLQETVTVPCCRMDVTILQTLNLTPSHSSRVFTCPNAGTTGCQKTYEFSWCSNKLCDRERYKRNHCSICKRCGDHRDVHCNDCNRCYFAGVSSSFVCPCKDPTKKQHHVCAPRSGGSGSASSSEISPRSSPSPVAGSELEGVSTVETPEAAQASGGGASSAPSSDSTDAAEGEDGCVIM